MVRAANSASSLILTVLSLALASPIVHAGCAPDAGARNIEISTRQQGPADTKPRCRDRTGRAMPHVVRRGEPTPSD